MRPNAPLAIDGRNAKLRHYPRGIFDGFGIFFQGVIEAVNRAGEPAIPRRAAYFLFLSQL